MLLGLCLTPDQGGDPMGELLVQACCIFTASLESSHVMCCLQQVVLLGLCLTPDHGGDPMGELLVQPLAAYSCSSDSVPMICVATTPDGRIFAGGQNGGVYEIVYSSRDTWRQKRMFKVRADSALCRLSH